MRGGDGVPWPAAGADFFGLFFFFGVFLLVFMGILRTCGHAITPCDSLSALLTACHDAQLITCIARGLSIKHSVTT